MLYIWGPHEPKILPQPLFFILTHVSVTQVSSLRDFFHAGCKDGMFSEPFHIQHVSAACTHGRPCTVTACFSPESGDTPLLDLVYLLPWESLTFLPLCVARRTPPVAPPLGSVAARPHHPLRSSSVRPVLALEANLQQKEKGWEVASLYRHLDASSDIYHQCD